MASVNKFDVVFNILQRQLWTYKSVRHHHYPVDQDLSYGEILAGRPGAWLVKKIYFIYMQSKKIKMELMMKFKMIL